MNSVILILDSLQIHFSHFVKDFSFPKVLALVPFDFQSIATRKRGRERQFIHNFVVQKFWVLPSAHQVLHVIILAVIAKLIGKAVFVHHLIREFT